MIGIFLLLVGVGLGVGSLITRARTQRFVESAARGQAQVTRLEHRRSSKGASMYRPVFRFTTEAGTQHEVVSRVGSNPPSYKVGDMVPVLYNPARPEEARIHSFLQVWFLPVVFGGLSLIFLAGGTLALLEQANR